MHKNVPLAYLLSLVEKVLSVPLQAPSSASSSSTSWLSGYALHTVLPSLQHTVLRLLSAIVCNGRMRVLSHLTAGVGSGANASVGAVSKKDGGVLVCMLDLYRTLSSASGNGCRSTSGHGCFELRQQLLQTLGIVCEIMGACNGCVGISI